MKKHTTFAIVVALFLAFAAIMIPKGAALAAAAGALRWKRGDASREHSLRH